MFTVDALLGIGAGGSKQPRPFFLPLLTNVVEGVLDELLTAGCIDTDLPAG